MRDRLWYIAVLMVLCIALSSYAAVGFSRYNVIIERRPFGTPAEEPPPPPPVVDEPPAFVQQLRMVAITESPAGIRVGFLDMRERPHRTYFLYVGETESGLLLADANFDREEAWVSVDGKRYPMRMGERGVSQEMQSELQQARETGRRSSAGREIRVADGDNREEPSSASYQARREQRLADKQRAREEAEQLSEEEKARQLREYHLRLLSEGRPLPAYLENEPLELTDEEEAQLVQQGVLEPVD